MWAAFHFSLSAEGGVEADEGVELGVAVGQLGELSREERAAGGEDVEVGGGGGAVLHEPLGVGCGTFEGGNLSREMLGLGLGGVETVEDVVGLECGVAKRLAEAEQRLLLLRPGDAVAGEVGGCVEDGLRERGGDVGGDGREGEVRRGVARQTQGGVEGCPRYCGGVVGLLELLLGDVDIGPRSKAQEREGFVPLVGEIRN